MNLKLIFIIYLILVNILSFLVMGIDKYKAIKSKVRISEKTIFLLSLFFGALGTLIGMYTFHHKTKHLKFIILIPILLIINVVCILYILHLIWTGNS